MKQQNTFTSLCVVSAVAVLVAGPAISAYGGNLLAYESFGNATDGSSINGYPSTTPGYSVGLSSAWSQLYNNGATLKHRSSSIGWTGAQNNLSAVGSTLSIQSGGYFNFLECMSWGLEQAQVALATPMDMTTNGTWYLSFCSSSGDFNYAAQMGLNDGTNELMWGNGYSGGGQGLTAHFGSMGSYNNGGAIKGGSGISPSMSSGFDVILYVAQLQQVVGTGVTVNIYAYDLNTTTGLPTDISTAGSPLWSTTLPGVNNRFTNLELDLSGDSQYPDIAELRVGTTWASVTAGQAAANQIWSGAGADNNWTTTNNWVGGALPNQGDYVTLAGTLQLVNNMNAGFSLGSLTFSNNAGSFNITNAANTMVLTGGLTNNSVNAQTIDVPVSMNTTQAINAASGNLIFGQNINNNGNTVTFTGSGNITISGTFNGAGGVVQTGTGTITIPLPLFPAASLTGGVVIQSGTVALVNPGFWICTNTISGGGNLVVSGSGPLLLWGADNLTGTTTVSNGTLLVGLTPDQSLGSTIQVLDGATFGVTARADTNYVSPASLIIGSSIGATLQFGLTGLSQSGPAGTNNAPLRATNVTINGRATINIASCPFGLGSYPLFTGYSSGTLALGSQPAGYTGNLAVSGSTVYYTVTSLDNNYRPFIHPGCLSQVGDFARMKAKVQAGAHPWIDSYNLLISDNGAQSNYLNHAQQQIYRNSSGGNYQFIAWDAQAAYELSLRWMITGDNNYADAAVRIFNAWANTCTNVTGDPNAQLIALNGYQFACAAENLHTYTNWAAADLARFQWWFRYGPAPGVMNGWWVGSPEGFLRSHWGQCPEHDWANWDLSNMNQLLAIGVLCDDRSVYNYALNYYKFGYAGNTDVQGNGSANRVIYQVHPGYMGQWQEAGRDQGHAMMGPALLGFFCEIAWNQGDDIFSYYTNELLTGTEYESKWNSAPETVVENNWVPPVLIPGTVPYVSYFNCAGWRQTDLAGQSRGNRRMGWDLIYNHYVNILGIAAPYTAIEAQQVRPEGAGDNDVIGYTTLTHYLDPILFSSVPAPSAVVAQVKNTAATISWIGSSYASSYNVKRSTDGVNYTTIASGMAMDHYYTDVGLVPGTNYYYTVSAIVNGVETTNSLPIQTQANQFLSGTVIGSPGSYDCCSTIYRVFDGSLRDWYDAANTSGDWAGLDLGVSNVITKVGYCPRPGFAYRMTGGQFQGCNVPDFGSGVVTLFTISSGPADNFPPTMTYQTISNPGAFRYVRYIGPSNGSCNVAEVEFYGYPGSPIPPLPPTALTATTPFAGAVTLTWTAPATASSFNVKRALTSGGPYTIVATNVTAVTYTDTGLAYGATYYYVVSAVNANGESANSAEVSATTVAYPPAGGSLLWSGAITATWDTSTANWLNNSAVVTYQNGASVYFDDTASGNKSLTIAATMTPSDVVFNNSWYGYTLSGSVINASGSLGKYGGNSLVLNSANTFSGGVTIGGGSVTLGNAGALGAGTITLSGGTLNNNVAATLTNSILISGSGGTIQLGSANNFTLTGPISGNGSLTLGNDGDSYSIYLWGANTMTGGSIVVANNSNYVRFSSPSVGNGNVDWIFNNTSAGHTTLEFASGTIPFGSLSGNGIMQGNYGSPMNVTMLVGGDNNSTVFSGIIHDNKNSAGPIGLTKTGTGTLRLTGACDYTGQTTVSNGELIISTVFAGNGNFWITNGAALGVTNSSSTSTLVSNLVVSAKTTLEFQNVSSTTTPLILASNMTAGGSCTVEITGTNGLVAANTYPLIRYSGTFSGAFTHLQLQMPSSWRGTLTNSGNQISLANVAVVSTVPPQMSMTVSGQALQVSWPQDHTGWRLQMNADLGTTNWQDVAGTSASNSVFIPPTNDNAFFRLVYP